MTQDGTAIVYVRRRRDDGLDGIIDQAEQYYASGHVDILVVDLSGDPGALAVLGRRGDPVRYLTDAAVAPIGPLLQRDSGLAAARRVVVVDDRPPDGRVAPNIQFLARADFALATAEAR